jgi:hypothetical protein
MEIQLESPKQASPARVDEIIAALEQTAEELGVEVQAGEQAWRWSMIGWADYRKHQRRWKRFGGITVYLHSPEHFALTKLARASAVDLDDIRAVLRAQGGSWRRLAAICGRALREAPRSSAQALFRRQVEHFFVHSGRTVWGAGFIPGRAIAEFQRSYAKRP